MEFPPKETKEGAPVPGCSCFFILKMELSVPRGSHSAEREGEVKREKRKQMPVPCCLVLALPTVAWGTRIILMGILSPTYCPPGTRDWHKEPTSVCLEVGSEVLRLDATQGQGWTVLE